MKYKIGQILYVLLNREMKICPVQIVEEITKRTIDGESTSYIIKTGNNKQLIPLSDINGQVFESIDLLKQTLLDRVAKSIDVIIHSTLQKSKEWYPERIDSFVQEVQNVSEESNTLQALDIGINEDAMITLPDGTVAKVKMSV